MSGFEIDEKKLNRALAPKESTAWEDLKWTSAVLGLLVGFTLTVGLLVGALLSLL